MSATKQLPISRHSPQIPGLSARITHASGRPALSITASPQTIELAFTNRTPESITAGPATLQLRFRPGVLAELASIALAPQSESQWVLSVAQSPEGVQLLFAGVEQFSLQPGGEYAIRIDGITAAAEGGSRSTRVEFLFDNLFHANGIELTGNRLVHLPILRWHEPATFKLRDIRTGSVATAGPFTAEFREAPSLLNDGKTENVRTLRVRNSSDAPVVFEENEDASSRFHLSYRTGSDLDPRGLIGSGGDRLFVNQHHTLEHWQKDHHTLHCARTHVMPPDKYIDLEVRVHTSAPSGRTQILLSFENITGHDDDELVLTLELGAVAEIGDAVHIVKPLQLRGSGASIQLHASEEGVHEGEVVPGMSVNREGRFVGRFDITTVNGLMVKGDNDLSTMSLSDTGNANFSGTGDFGGSLDVTGDITATGTISDRNGPVVPIGTIVMWSDFPLVPVPKSRVPVPSGWALCDGAEGRPDLRSRFVVGEDARNPEYARGSMQGEARHGLTEAEMPSHNHDVTLEAGGEHVHNFTQYSIDKVNNNGKLDNSVEWDQFPTTGTTVSAGRHTHKVSVSPSGRGEAHENRPPYYALAFIIKIS